MLPGRGLRRSVRLIDETSNLTLAFSMRFLSVNSRWTMKLEMDDVATVSIAR